MIINKLIYKYLDIIGDDQQINVRIWCDMDIWGIGYRPGKDNSN